jgi:PKD repeat protein
LGTEEAVEAPVQLLSDTPISWAFSPPTSSFNSTSPDWLGPTSRLTSTAAGCEPISHIWDFGDGTINTLTHPVHKYISPGQPPVSLTVTDIVGTDVDSNVITIYGPPDVSLTAHPTRGIPPLVVAFTGSATTTPPGDLSVTYLWDFGDGVTSSESSPRHVYVAAGAYTVTLVTSNPAGSDLATRIDYIGVDQSAEVFLPLVLRPE